MTVKSNDHKSCRPIYPRVKLMGKRHSFDLPDSYEEENFICAK